VWSACCLRRFAPLVALLLAVAVSRVSASCRETYTLGCCKQLKPEMLKLSSSEGLLSLYLPSFIIGLY